RGNGRRARPALQRVACGGVLPAPDERDRPDSRVCRPGGRSRGGAALDGARSRRVVAAARGGRAVLLAPGAQSTGRRFVNPLVRGRGLAGRRVARILAGGALDEWRGGGRLEVTSRRAGEHVNPFYHSIYKVVRHIPKGRIATFGWPAEAYDSAPAAHTRAASSRRSRRLRDLRT